MAADRAITCNFCENDESGPDYHAALGAIAMPRKKIPKTLKERPILVFLALICIRCCVDATAFVPRAADFWRQARSWNSSPPGRSGRVRAEATIAYEMNHDANQPRRFFPSGRLRSLTLHSDKITFMLFSFRRIPCWSPENYAPLDPVTGTSKSGKRGPVLEKAWGLFRFRARSRRGVGGVCTA